MKPVCGSQYIFGQLNKNGTKSQALMKHCVIQCRAPERLAQKGQHTTAMSKSVTKVNIIIAVRVLTMKLVHELIELL